MARSRKEFNYDGEIKEHWNDEENIEKLIEIINKAFSKLERTTLVNWNPLYTEDIKADALLDLLVKLDGSESGGLMYSITKHKLLDHIRMVNRNIRTKEVMMGSEIVEVMEFIDDTPRESIDRFKPISSLSYSVVKDILSIAKNETERKFILLKMYQLNIIQEDLCIEIENELKDILDKFTGTNHEIAQFLGLGYYGNTKFRRFVYDLKQALRLKGYSI